MGTILVVDDEEQVRGFLRKALERFGHAVLEANNGKEGLRIYQNQPADVVIADILMPEADGLSCILQLREFDPGVRVIAISGGGQFHAMDVLEVARHFGARHAFWKPFDLDQVLTAVNEELEAGPAA